jgi:hypothetical protein
MKCGIILGGISTDTDWVFILQKRIVRIMAGIGFGFRSSCRSLFKKLDILPVLCQYIFSLMIFVWKIWKIFRPTHQYIVWIQETRLSFIGLLPIPHAFHVLPMLV